MRPDLSASCAISMCATRCWAASRASLSSKTSPSNVSSWRSRLSARPCHCAARSSASLTYGRHTSHYVLHTLYSRYAMFMMDAAENICMLQSRPPALLRASIRIMARRRAMLKSKEVSGMQGPEHSLTAGCSAC